MEDRRFGGGRRVMVGGGIGSVILLLLYLLFGGDAARLFESGAPIEAPYGAPTQGVPTNDELGQFASAVLGDTEDVWNKLFRDMGREYEEPRLVLFRGGTQSGCGFGDSAVGPFYCPADDSVYLDLSFFSDLSRRFGAPGDFAQAYVIAHEVGHHVQNQLGIRERMQRERPPRSERERNALSVRLELQADYFAGVWAHHARNRDVLERGDIEEALRAASAIGDDRLQRRARGYVVPDSFTHGTSEQRMRWFRRGLESGDPAKGDTFSVENP